MPETEKEKENQRLPALIIISLTILIIFGDVISSGRLSQLVRGGSPSAPPSVPREVSQKAVLRIRTHAPKSEEQTLEAEVVQTSKPAVVKRTRKPVVTPDEEEVETKPPKRPKRRPTPEPEAPSEDEPSPIKKGKPVPSEEDEKEREQNIPPATPKPESAEDEAKLNRPECEPVCKPFVLKHGSLFVQRSPDATTEPELFKCSAMTTEERNGKNVPVYSFTDQVRNVVIDIGTNADPDSVEDYWNNKSIGFLWFEPQVTLHTHPMHLPATRATQFITKNRVVGFPAAVAPNNGHMKLHLSAISGCTSLLAMNDAALKDPSAMSGSFQGGDKSFPDYRTAKGGFTGCIETRRDLPWVWTPVVRGGAAMDMIPRKLNVVLLSIDAQGFDLHVMSSFGKTAKRAHHIQIECQDLPFGHKMFLTKGAFSCAEVRHCIESNLPHRMINPMTGEPSDECGINNPSHERNCFFRLMTKPFMVKVPKILTRVRYRIKYGLREDLQCPSFA